ncbi:MAG: VWA domain-containing protein [Candidatus Thorarchaeota archaeon]
MKCKECNTKIKKNSEYCPYCGTEISENVKKNIDVDINIILDRSGSMATNKAATIKEYNSYILEQAQVEGKATISLYMFSSSYEVVYENKNIKDAPPLNNNVYKPFGTTALLDAIGRTILRKDTYYASLKKHKPSKILFVIITDGLENSSIEFAKADIIKIIDNKKSENWDFAFIGAGIDAFSEKGRSGINFNQNAIMSVNNDSDGWNYAFSSLRDSTVSYRTTSSTSRFKFNTGDEQ